MPGLKDSKSTQGLYELSPRVDHINPPTASGELFTWAVDRAGTYVLLGPDMSVTDP